MDTRKIRCNEPKISTRLHYYRVMCPKDVEGMTNSADPDQTGSTLSTLFAQTNLSENLESLWYFKNKIKEKETIVLINLYPLPSGIPRTV